MDHRSRRRMPHVVFPLYVSHFLPSLNPVSRLRGGRRGYLQVSGDGWFVVILPLVLIKHGLIVDSLIRDLSSIPTPYSSARTLVNALKAFSLTINSCFSLPTIPYLQNKQRVGIENQESRLTHPNPRSIPQHPKNTPASSIKRFTKRILGGGNDPTSCTAWHQFSILFTPWRGG